MDKTKIKHEALDNLMLAIASALLTAQENEEPEVQKEMKKQAKRIMKFLGYNEFSGIA